jgi:PAS domain S-box-containing protein
MGSAVRPTELKGVNGLSHASRIYRLASSALLSLLLVQLLYAAELKETKRVLVLYSEAKDFPAHEITERGIRAGFRSNERFDVQLYTEYLEVSRFGGPSHARVMVDYLGRKYSGREIHAIIAVYPYAVDFLLNEGPSLFPGVPIIATAIDRSYAQDLERSPARRLVTGNIMGDNITALAGVALLLRPKTKRIALVAGTSPMNVHSERVFRRDLGPYAGRIDLIDLTKLSMEETLSRVASLPPDTLVFYSAISRDGAGKIFVPREALSLIARASTAPVFGIYEPYLGFGIVGGPLVSYEELGRESAALALRVMAGESPASIPFGGDQAYVNVYDWRELKRWGIAESALPPGSTLRFKEFSMWEEHRWWIVGGLAFLCLETLLIGALVISLGKRRRFEEALTRSESKLKKAQEVGLVGSFVYDVKANKITWSVGANEIWGVPPDLKLDYESFLQIVHPDDRAYVDRHWKAALKGEPYDIEHRVVAYDKVKWVRSKMEVEFDEYGNPLVGTGIVQDIGRRKQM